MSEKPFGRRAASYDHREAIADELEEEPCGRFGDLGDDAETYRPPRIITKITRPRTARPQNTGIPAVRSSEDL